LHRSFPRKAREAYSSARMVLQRKNEGFQRVRPNRSPSSLLSDPEDPGTFPYRVERSVFLIRIAPGSSSLVPTPPHMATAHPVMPVLLSRRFCSSSTVSSLSLAVTLSAFLFNIDRIPPLSSYFSSSAWHIPLPELPLSQRCATYLFPSQLYLLTEPSFWLGKDDPPPQVLLSSLL